jgi:hypothetical protein
MRELVMAFVTLGDVVNYKVGQLVISFTSTQSRSDVRCVIPFAHMATLSGNQDLTWHTTP